MGTGGTSSACGSRPLLAGHAVIGGRRAAQIKVDLNKNIDTTNFRNPAVITPIVSDNEKTVIVIDAQ